MQPKLIQSVWTQYADEAKKVELINRVRESTTLLNRAIDQQFSPAAAKFEILNREFDRLAAQAGKARQASFDFGIFARNVAATGALALRRRPRVP